MRLAQYPIVPTFADWVFPHNNLPPSWKECHIPEDPDHDVSRFGTQVLSRDIRCRITAYREGTEHAHLVPTSETFWFDQNQMARYAISIKDPRNLILLRSDLHSIFDSRKFAVVPKRSTLTEVKSLLVVHSFVPQVTSEITRLYHNVGLQTLSGIAKEVLFARFSWTIFPSLCIFLNGGVPRALLIREEQGNNTTKTFSAAECRTKARPVRSLSPKKRKRPDTPAAEDECEDEDLGFEEFRGRQRQRVYSTSSSSGGDDPLSSSAWVQQRKMWAGFSSTVAAN
jgi:HNH endonuclease